MQKERDMEKSKMELITGVSHDLKTPLTSIIGYLELLRTESYQDQEEYNRFLQNSYNRAMHLKKLIDDLFEYTRLTTPNVQLNLRAVDVYELLEQMLVEFEPLAQEHHVSIIKKIGADECSQIFKKTGRCLCFIKIRHYTHRLYIEVENSGPPLTQEQELRIFERFYKVDDSRSSEGIQTSSGLGLSIARNIIELHGGTLRLNHNDGIYIFSIAVPLHCK